MRPINEYLNRAKLKFIGVFPTPPSSKLIEMVGKFEKNKFILKMMSRIIISRYVAPCIGIFIYLLIP